MISVLISSWSLADNLSLKYGLGIKDEVTSSIKYLSLGYESSLFHPLFKLKADGGAWFDTVNSSSGFIATSVGMRVEPGYLYIDNYFGLAYIGTIDNLLGIPFEFTEEFGIGVQDSHGRYTGIEYRHFSNAGISKVNIGRDFLLINIGIPI